MNHQKTFTGVIRFNFPFLCSVKIVALMSLILSAEVLSGSIVYAQLQGVEIGDRVRITAQTVDDRRIMGTVASFSPTSVSLARKDTTLLIPYPLIQKVDKSTGKKRNYGKGLLIGSLGGGFLLGGMAAFTKRSCNDDAWCPNPGFIGGFGAGALYGGDLRGNYRNYYCFRSLGRGTRKHLGGSHSGILSKPKI